VLYLRIVAAGAMSSMIPCFKFIIVGASGVGKTAILKRLIDDMFTPDSQATIGVEFDLATVEVDGNPVKLQIWDTAGQERFRSIAKSYFRNAVGAILVFDICERKSFEDVNQWLSDVHALCDPSACVILIGNKCDLADSRTITLAEAERFGQQHQLAYIETSALSGVGIREAFLKAATDIYRNAQRGVQEHPAAIQEQAAGGCC
jgi:small GTP-binding protein